jgi:hypothetical protein
VTQATRDYLIAHEVAHFVQFKKLGSDAMSRRLANEGWDYHRKPELKDTHLERLDIVSKNFSLESIAVHVGRALSTMIPLSMTCTINERGMLAP